MTSKRKIAYISGAISSDPHYLEKFADAETVLLGCGFDVLNPTCVPALLSYSQHMQIDKIFVSACDVIVLLPDWKISDGAKEELELGRRLKKEVILYKNILTYAQKYGMI